MRDKFITRNFFYGIESFLNYLSSWLLNGFFWKILLRNGSHVQTIDKKVALEVYGSQFHQMLVFL